MIGLEQVLAELLGEIDRQTLEHYVAHDWVRPVTESKGWRFAEIDVARIRLVRYLQHDVAVNDDGMDVVLHLLDQVYDLRHRLGLNSRDEETISPAEFWEEREEF